MDRISELPEITLEHILSFLKPKKAAQTSTLSKKWLHLWRTRSVLHFNQMYFHKGGLNQFIDLVDNTLIRHHQQGTRIQEFVLSTRFDDDMFYPLVDKWLKIAVDNKVEVLNLSILCGSDSVYVVPNQIFEAKSLIALDIYRNVKLSLDNFTNFKCRDLKKLKLYSVDVDDRTIQNIVCNCPLIEEFCLGGVKGLDRVLVSSLSNLKIFSIATSTKLKEVCIQAPMLQSCDYESESSDLAPWFNLDASQNLKDLSLCRVGITDMDFHKLLSQNLHLESLSLCDCNTLENIKISCHSLKQFTLFGNTKPFKVTIDCPNLLSLVLCGLRLSQISFASPLAQEKSEIYILGMGYNIDFSRFYELREFLRKSNVSSVWLEIESTYMTFTEEWRAISLPPAHEVEKLKLVMDLDRPASTYLNFVNGLFWSCRPKTISLLWSPSNCCFIKFLCKELMEKGDGNCCSSNGIKCWRHHLLSVEFKSFDGIQREWKSHSCNDVADGRLTLEPNQEICLTIEWSELGAQVDDIKESNGQKLTNVNDLKVV